MTSAFPPALRASIVRRLFVFFKLASICVLVALLHVPMAMTRGVLAERQRYQAEATDSIASVWGREQRLVGPVLAVPYGYRTEVTRSKVVNGQLVQVEETDLVDATAYFLPEVLTVSGTAVPEIRRRGIYETVVYSAELKFAGRFQPDFVASGIAADRIDWARARVYFGVSDLRGIRSMGTLQIGEGGEATFESAESVSGALLPLAAKVAGAAAGFELPFSMEAVVQGSRQLEIAPTGKITSVTLDSAWSDPSFIGASLPASHRVEESGFHAEWQSSHLSRGFPQSWSSGAVTPTDIVRKIETASFGVRFVQAVDGYSLVERARKYGTLFFVLIFAVFFLFEITSALRIHPLQYALVGVALCLFFLGFLALSEFWAPGAAYAVAAMACTALVSWYARSFLKTGWRTLVITGGLAATYGYLYFVLKSQDYALIAGTAALFAALALVMFCTRRIDWYAIELGPENSSQPRMDAKGHE